VLRLGARPEALLPLLELASDWELAPQTSLTALHALAESRTLLPTVRASAATLEASVLRHLGRMPEAEARIESLGFVRHFRMLGPFSNEGRRGFATVFPPETSLEAPTPLGTEFQGAEHPIQWRDLPERRDVGSVALDPFMTPSANACAFLETFVEVERARPLALWTGASGAVRVYWNGRVVFEDAHYRGGELDRGVAVVEARAGWNRVLVKLCNDDADFSAYMRLSEANGAFMQVHADPAGATAAAPAAATSQPLPAAPGAVGALLEEALRNAPSDAHAHEALARYLSYTTGEESTEHRARDLAARAVELAPSAQNCLFAARLQETRDDMARLIRQAVALAPNDPEVQLANAFHVAGGASGERSLPLFEAIPPDTTFGITALTTRARILARLGFDESARGLLETLDARFPESLVHLRARISREAGLGHTSVADTLREQLLTARPDDSNTRRELVARALRRGEREHVLEEIQRELFYRPNSVVALAWASDIYDALGDEGESVAMLVRATELDPHDASSRVALGERLLSFGRRDQALATLREALALRPQDPGTRQLIEHIEPEQRPDEAYATAIETILARRSSETGWPGRVLHDLEVRTVLPNGLSSAFHQRVFQVHDEEGARALRQHAIQYEPGAQWVDVRSARVYRGDRVLSAFETGETSLAEPEYSMYFSARQLIVSLPELEPGDVIELRYRIDDIGSRNEYEGYFGQLRGLQGQMPIERLEHIILSPTSRTLVFNTPSIALAHETRTDGDRRIDRFSAEHIAPLRSEPGQPGYTEIAPYLHVSTYQSWNELGRFWWSLSERQFEPDADLERTVHTLIDDTTDVRTRVSRIYAWVIDHIRYVGLEFGIHGHMPYRVSDVVDRGFGDCKDTASLLYAMFRIAGIDSRVVLVRTTRNGEIGESPASLSAFDHAIAYVPELDLFLDGTSERSGIDELPVMDQGALGLVVGPSTVELRHLPVRTAEQAGRRRELTVTFAPNGSVTMEGNEELMGSEAPPARHRFEAEESRARLLGVTLSGMFPGFELTSQEFSSLTDRSQPVRYTWRGTSARFGERNGASIRVTPTVISELTRSWASLPQRTHALVLGPPSHYRERRTLALGSLRAEVPRGGLVESPFGHLSVRYSRVGTSVVIETELVINAQRVEVSEYRAFREFSERADALLRERVVVSGVAGGVP
jgi:tetratricopeptide (TPR) repeat protein